MKKTTRFVLIMCLMIMTTLCLVSCTNVSTINNVMKCELPESAEILEYTYKWNPLNGTSLGAKVSMSKDDYETFVSSLSNKYLICELPDCRYDVMDDGEVYIYPPNSAGNYIGFESTAYSWWNMEVDNIDCILYMDSRNLRGAKHPCARRMYIVECDQDILIYFSYDD